jgi:GNAT superfamily N-acetyltransferase
MGIKTMNKILKLIENEFGFIDWDIYTDESFDDEGNEIKGEACAKIDNLFVKREFRGQGKAKEFIELALIEIKKSGFSSAIIVPEPKEYDVDFERLASFYAAMGLNVVAY